MSWGCWKLLDSCEGLSICRARSQHLDLGVLLQAEYNQLSTTVGWHTAVDIYLQLIIFLDTSC